MDEKHRALLRSYHVQLCQDLHAEAVASNLFQAGILTQDDLDSISAESSKNKQNEKFLNIIQRRGPCAFSAFVQSLKRLNFPHQFLLDELPSEQKSISIITDSANSVPAKVQKMEEGFDEVPEGGYDRIDAPPSVFANEGTNHLNSEADGPFKIGSSKSQKTDSDLRQAKPDHHVPIYGAVSTNDLEADSFYPMSKNPRGLCVIINNKDFEPSSGMENYTRNGTDVDASAFAMLFEELGFTVESHKNMSCYQIRKILKQASSRDFSKYSAFCCCMLSHGQEGIIYGIDGTIEIRELTANFRGRNLAGKPKMFFFQACQGSEYMDAVEPDGMEVDGPADYGNDISLPTESDFLYAYSTVPGYYSWRNSSKGSWFIQAIIEVFRQYAHRMDVVRMLTRVNGIVATKKSETGQRGSHNKRQISTVVSQLRKELYFFPPAGPLRHVELE